MKTPRLDSAALELPRINLSRLWVLWPLALVLVLGWQPAFGALQAEQASPNSIDLTWTAPGDDGDVGTAAQYELRYSTSVITEANWSAATLVSGLPAPQVAGSAESFTVTGLQSSTTYYFAIKAADEMPNWSALSNVASASTTVETTAPSAIANLGAGNETETSIELVWTAPGDDGMLGTAAQYDIRYSTSPIGDANWDQATQVSGEPSPKAGGSAEAFVVSGLVAGTTYYFAVKVADEVPNWSGLSNVVSRTTATDQTPPAAIDDLQASSGENNGEIDLVWTAPGDDGHTGIADLYAIAYSKEVITEANWQLTSTVSDPPAPLEPGSLQAFTITGLDFGDVYYVAMVTGDDNGNISGLSNIDTAVSTFSIISDVDDDQGNVPTTFELSQNYPNPFNPSTTIEYAVPRTGHVRLTVYNVLGQVTTTLVDMVQTPGQYTAVWDGTDQSHQPVATGVYLYHLQAGEHIQSKRMVLVK